MTVVNRLVFLAVLLVAPLAGCENSEEASLLDTGSDSASKDTASDKKAVSGTDTRAETDTSTDSDAAKEGAALGKTTQGPVPESESERLIAELREKRRSLELRLREVAERERRVAALEIQAVKKAGELQRVKKDIEKLMLDLRAKNAVVLEKYRQRQAEVAKQEEKKQEEKKKEVEKAEKLEQERADEMAALAEELASKRDERIEHLVSTLKGMRASAGAGMLTSMDQTDAVEVLRRISPRQAAGFLGAMPGPQAAALAQAMLGPRSPKADKTAKRPKDQEISKENKEPEDGAR